MVTEGILAFKDVTMAYEKGGMKLAALKGLSFSLASGNRTLVNGPSGAGKTSLIYIAGLIKKPSAGDIRIKGVSTIDLNENQRSNMIRNEVGFIFRRANLLPHLNVLENVLLPMVSFDEDRAMELLEIVEVDNWNRFPVDLSIEEEQKVTLARSLANNPSILLADEPTAELDLKATENFLGLLEKIENLTILMTSNNTSFSELFQETYRLEYGMLKSYSSEE